MHDRILNRSFDYITINQTNSLGSIGCSIEHLIDHLILSRSIELIYYDRLDARSII
jgi:hypothetical protein